MALVDGKTLRDEQVVDVHAIKPHLAEVPAVLLLRVDVITAPDRFQDDALVKQKASEEFSRGIASFLWNHAADGLPIRRGLALDAVQCLS